MKKMILGIVISLAFLLSGCEMARVSIVPEECLLTGEEFIAGLKANAETREKRVFTELVEHRDLGDKALQAQYCELLEAFKKATFVDYTEAAKNAYAPGYVYRRSAAFTVKGTDGSTAQYFYVLRDPLSGPNSGRLAVLLRPAEELVGGNPNSGIIELYFRWGI